MNLEPIRRLSNFSDTKLSHLQLSDRALMVATLLGISIGCTAPLPSAAVNSIDQYTSDTLSSFNKIISEINEVFVIDTDTVMSVANSIHRYRYQMVFNSTAIVDGLYFDKFSGVLGLSDNISSLLSEKMGDALFVEIDAIAKDIIENILNKE